MPKYPLEPLRTVRETQVKDARKELAQAIGRREGAETARRAAEARREVQARVVTAVREAEGAALAEGQLRARDLARADAWGVRMAKERYALVATVDKANATEVTAIEAEGQAQQHVAERHTEARVVETHHERWDAERRRALEAREEEASAEAWRPKR